MHVAQGRAVPKPGLMVLQDMSGAKAIVPTDEDGVTAITSPQHHPESSAVPFALCC